MRDLWEHQRRAVEFLSQRSHGALLMEAGTGKTLVMIEWVRRIFKRSGGAVPTVILAPQIVCPNIRREFLEHSEKWGDIVRVLDGDISKKRIPALFEDPRQSIFITNYEAMLRPKFVAALKTRGVKILICDESHRIKNPQAATTKNIHRFARDIPFSLIMTGTAVLRNQMDLWGQLRVINEADPNFVSWRSKYFYDENAGMPQAVYFPNWRVRPQAERALSESLSRCAIIVKKSECLDLPPLVKQRFLVPLEGQQAKVYAQMESDLVASLGKEKSVSTTVITKLLRLQQICSGILELTTSDQTTEIETAKITALRQLLEEWTPEHKVIVWNHWRPAIRRIAGVCDSLGLSFVTVTGEDSPKAKELAVNAFRSDPTVRVLIGNQGAGGIGINLTESPCAIYFSKTHNLEHDTQSEARNYRGGSEIHKQVTRIDLITEGTIEEEIDKCLREKAEIGERLLRWAKERSASKSRPLLRANS